MADIAIRPATDEDILGLHDLGVVVTRETHDPIDRATDHQTVATWWSHDALRSSIASTRHWMAEEGDGRIVGIAGLSRRADIPVMWKLYVHPEQGTAGFYEARREPDPPYPDQVWMQRRL